MEAGKEMLTRDVVRDATRQGIQVFKWENGELRQLVAHLSLEVYSLRKTAIPMPHDVSGTGDERCGQVTCTIQGGLVSSGGEQDQRSVFTV
jgi:hypothetical protein